MTPLRTKQAIEAFDNTPVGDVVFRPYLKKGYVKANGATVNRADYPRLVAFANANNLWTTNPTSEPWKFGQGNGSTTMVLPNYVGRFIQGGDSMSKANAGLPNITGSVRCGLTDESGQLYGKGAFLSSRSETTTQLSYGKGSQKQGVAVFNANKFNPLYGASNTVQPPSIQLIPQLRY